MPLLFSYGTLQQEEVQVSTFGRKLEGEKDLLIGYEPSLVKIPDAELARRLQKLYDDNVRKTDDEWSNVQGTVFEVTEDELAKSDALEGQLNYRRIIVPLASGNEAWVYVHND